MKNVVLWLVILLTVPALQAEAFVMVDVYQDAYIDDYDHAVVVDGVPNGITNSQAMFIANGMLSSGYALEGRGIMTFDISAFGGQTLDYAKLTGMGSQSSGQVLTLSIYSGNGLVELSDYDAPATPIGALTLAPTGSYYNVQPFEQDITAALQNLFDAHAGFAEFRVSSSLTDPLKDATILSGEAQGFYKIPEGQIGPRLVLDFHQSAAVPEPATVLLFGIGLVGAGLRRR